MTVQPPPELNLDIGARWKDEDAIVAEGSVDLGGSTRLQAWVCQDGEMTVALRPKEEPELKDGKIEIEWERREVEIGPIFDPAAHFEVVVVATSEPAGLPYFIVRIPVEGQPE